MKIKILFIYRTLSSFVKADLDILQKSFNVKAFRFTGDKKSILKLLILTFLADITFSWFAARHAFYAVRFSKILRKKSIVVIGGYELANLPEIDYGLLRFPKSAYKVKYVLENADIVLTVDDSLKIEAIKTGVNGQNIRTIPTGYDSNKWRPDGDKEDLVFTVSIVNSWNRARLKGLDVFVKSALYLPNVRFIVIGVPDEVPDKLKSIAPTNVKFLNSLPQDELILYYQKAKVYCQISIREGLPNALCESMLCECVPVGTNVCGIPTAIGDTGFYVPYGDPKATSEVIEKALSSDKGVEARERIKMKFPLEIREKEIINIIDNLI